LIKTLQALVKLDADAIFPGHGNIATKSDIRLWSKASRRSWRRSKHSSAKERPWVKSSRLSDCRILLPSPVA
jgi:glyoxylase-like metal-dependent hydrolase (beta-lactamase superfamily II)